MTPLPFVHDALFYDREQDYVDGLTSFVADGVSVGAAVLVAVPAPKLAVLAPALTGLGGPVQFVDMQQQGKNPGRILPFIRDFIDAHHGQPVHFVGEPIWPGRSAAEISEGHRHEALINHAFQSTSSHIVCPYDTRNLNPSVVDAARCTHPTIVENGQRRRSGEYTDPVEIYAAAGSPLPEPSGQVSVLSVAGGLARFRSDVKAYAIGSGLARDRVADFVQSAHEAAANMISHANGRGTALIWHAGDRIVCEVSSPTTIADPEVGRRTPSPTEEQGRGIWLMHQLCDLVELRSDEGGTVVRLHMRIP